MHNASSAAARTLVYFGHVPQEGAGSAIIVLRHLRRFAADGWDVRIVADWGQDHTLCREAGWPVFELSHRKPWWPPLNPDRPLSRALRAWLWAGEAHAWLAATRVDGVLTYLSAFSDTLSLAAVGYAGRYRRKLATLIHDDTRCFADDPATAAAAHARRQWIVEHSTKAWFASPELAACYTLAPSQIGTLPPIPDGAAPASDSEISPPSSPLLVYAGNYWPPQLPTLAHIAAATRSAGGRFLAVLKENAEHLAYLRAAGVEWRAPFAKNTQALDHYRAHASAMVVSYAPSSDDMPWTRTSFPSKLIEYCHLGLPVVIVAAEDTAVVRWARARAFPDVFAPDDRAGLAAYVQNLHHADFRRDRSARALAFARSEFDPVKIQARLVASLLPSSL